MKRQSRRATLLTLLAAFYLPLTLVTGIFGMNIKEFDGEKAPSLSICFAALFVVIAVTAFLYGLYRYLPLAFKDTLSQRTMDKCGNEICEGGQAWLCVQEMMTRAGSRYSWDLYG